MSFEEDIQKMQAFEAKQRITGRIFDFAIKNDAVYIYNYYDDPNRKVVVIPDFVSGFTKSFKNEKNSPFCKCNYIEKIICNRLEQANNGLFHSCKLNKLDLSEFNTHEIDNVDYWFTDSEIGKLIIGNKFSIENIKSANSIFNASNIGEIINSEKSFNTKNLTEALGMFTGIKIGKLNLGDQFITSDSTNYRYMFNLCNIKQLDLGKNFTLGLGMNIRESRLFNGCCIEKLTIHKILLRDISEDIFISSDIKEIVLEDQAKNQECLDKLTELLPNTKITFGE